MKKRFCIILPILLYFFASFGQEIKRLSIGPQDRKYGTGYIEETFFGLDRNSGIVAMRSLPVGNEYRGWATFPTNYELRNCLAIQYIEVAVDVTNKGDFDESTPLVGYFDENDVIPWQSFNNSNLWDALQIYGHPCTEVFESLGYKKTWLEDETKIELGNGFMNPENEWVGLSFWIDDGTGNFDPDSEVAMLGHNSLFPGLVVYYVDNFSSPQHLKASFDEYSSGIMISWDPPKETFGKELHYFIDRAESNDFSSALPLKSTSETSYFDTNVVPGKTYYYCVRVASSENGDHNSTRAGMVVGRAMVEPKLEVVNPTSSTVWTVGNEVNVEWEDNLSGDVSLYLERGLDGEVTTIEDSTPSDGFYSFILHGNFVLGEYRLIVVSIDLPELWASSPPFFLQTPPLLAPTGVSASDGDYSGSISISWNTVSQATHYRVYRSDSNDPSTASAITDWQTQIYFDDELVASGTYYFYWIKSAASATGFLESELSSYNRGNSAIAVQCSSPVTLVEDASGLGIVQLSCSISGGTGGNILYKWYEGTSCSGPEIGYNSTIFVESSGDYTCKAYISGYENTCFDCGSGYATVNSGSGEANCQNAIELTQISNVIQGNTINGQANVSSYSCNSKNYSGKEVFYQFTPTLSGDATVYLGYEQNIALRLLVLSNCNEGGCFYEAPLGTYGVTYYFTVEAGNTYYLAIEEWTEVDVDYTLEVSFPKNFDIPTLSFPENNAKLKLWESVSLTWNKNENVYYTRRIQKTTLSDGRVFNDTTRWLGPDYIDDGSTWAATQPMDVEWFIEQKTLGSEIIKRSETWNFSFIENRPANSATNLLPEDGVILSSGPIHFSWETSDPDGDDVSCIFELHYQGALFKRVEGITSGSISLDEVFEAGDYFWYIISSDGKAGNSSGINRFSIESPIVREKANSPAPQDGDINQPQDLTLGWSECQNAIGYKVYYGKNSGLGDEYYVGTYPSNFCLIWNLSVNAKYYWRVDVLYETEIISGDIWNFTVTDESTITSEMATNPTPQNGSINQPQDLTLGWSECQNAIGYKVYYGKNSGLGDEYYVGTYSSNTCPIRNLSATDRYYWRVDVLYDSAIVSGDVWSFTVAEATGISDQNLNNFSVYPNPTTSILNINIPVPSNFERIRIIDNSGKVIRDEKVDGKSIVLQIGAIPSGVYILEIKGETDIRTTFIKQ